MYVYLINIIINNSRQIEIYMNDHESHICFI